MVLDSALLAVTSGDGANTGDPGTDPANNGTLGANGGAGLAGNATFSAANDLVANMNNTNFNFTKGATYFSAGGDLNVSVGRNLEISSGSRLNLNISGNMGANDDIAFETLFSRPQSSLVTAAEVYTDTKPANGVFYQVRNLDIVTSAVWSTDGTYSPHSLDFDYMRFDMSDIQPSAVILDFSGDGTVHLEHFDPMAQHEKYLNNASRPRYSDDPAYRTYANSFVSDADTAPAVITSAYQTKQLHLGHITLVSKTDGSSDSSLTTTDAEGNIHFNSGSSSLGSLYNDFAFTSGLRRYYFDLYIDNGTGRALMANNYYTADASKVFAQSAASGVISVNQTFENTLTAIERTFSLASADKVSVEAIIGGSSVKAETGSHAKVKNFSSALAVSKKFEHNAGVSALGIFAEYGDGGYDTFASVPRYGDVFGEGDVRTIGGGLFFKTQLRSDFFLAASIRGGSIQNDFSLKQDPWIQHPEVHSADTSSSYTGLHVEVGRVFRYSDMGEIEGYGQFFWTHSPEDQFTTRFGDHITIDSFDSTRARAGARIKNSLNSDSLQFYFGLAAEHEFDGKLSGRLNDDAFPHSVELQGTSAFGEMGLSIMPSENVSIIVGAYGWAGKLKGAGGGASINFSF
jgi:hypothetical protein